MPILRGMLLGFAKGLLLVGGATIDTVLSYGLERALSKMPERFGQGMITVSPARKPPITPRLAVI